MTTEMMSWLMPAATVLMGVAVGWALGRKRSSERTRLFVQADVSFAERVEEAEQKEEREPDRESAGTLEQTKAPAEVPGESEPARPALFIVDSMLLSQSFDYVCGKQARAKHQAQLNSFREVFHYAAGYKLPDKHTYVVAHLVPVKFAQQSAGGVRVADGSNIAVLEALDQVGLPLVAHFHSHPGFGRTANFPSNTDRRFQERLERGGHCAIGGIFSRDGYLRFFAGDLDRFVVEVIGKNVKKVGDNEFKLVLANERF